MSRRGGALLALAVLSATPAHASHHGWSKASSIGRTTLVVAALGVPAAKDDWRGELMSAGSLAGTAGATWSLKELIPERRPDGSDRKSFPSGHTSVSFAAAAVLEKRYGWQFGAPAFAVATFVGVARVAARKHYVHDVLAGAVLGGGIGWLVTWRQDDRVQLVPWADAGSGGVTVATHF